MLILFDTIKIKMHSDLNRNYKVRYSLPTNSAGSKLKPGRFTVLKLIARMVHHRADPTPQTGGFQPKYHAIQVFALQETEYQQLFYQ